MQSTLSSETTVSRLSVKTRSLTLYVPVAFPFSFEVRGGHDANKGDAVFMSSQTIWGGRNAEKGAVLPSPHVIRGSHDAEGERGLRVLVKWKRT